MRSGQHFLLAQEKIHYFRKRRMCSYRWSISMVNPSDLARLLHWWRRQTRYLRFIDEERCTDNIIQVYYESIWYKQAAFPKGKISRICEIYMTWSKWKVDPSGLLIWCRPNMSHIFIYFFHIPPAYPASNFAFSALLRPPCCHFIRFKMYENRTLN